MDENGAKIGFHQFSSVQFILFHHGNSHQLEAVLQCSMQTEVRKFSKGKHEKQIKEYIRRHVEYKIGVVGLDSARK